MDIDVFKTRDWIAHKYITLRVHTFRMKTRALETQQTWWESQLLLHYQAISTSKRMLITHVQYQCYNNCYDANDSVPYGYTDIICGINFATENTYSE